MRYRFVLQLDVTEDDDPDCLEAEELRTAERVVAGGEEARPELERLFASLEAELARRLAARAPQAERPS